MRELYMLREDASPWVTGTVELGSDGTSARETRLHRDPAGRITSTTITDPTGALTLTREDLNALSQPGVTRRYLGSTEQSREERSYDLRGRVETRTTFLNGTPIAALGFGWTLDGELESISGLQSGTLGYTRSAWSGNDLLVDGLTVDGATVAEVTGRDSELRPTDLTLTGVYDLSLSYDAMGRITARDAVSQDPELYGDIAWSGAYNDRGRLDWEGATTAEGQRWSVYDYDEPGWLTGATSSENGVESSRTWAYDAGGRRESSTLDGATEHALAWDGSALTEIDGAAWTLDPFDAVIRDDRGILFTRDPSGALVEVGDGANTTTLSRDPDGLPIASEDADGLRLGSSVRVQRQS